MKKITSNITFLFSGDILSKLIGFFAVTYLARVVGPSGFGKISIGLTFLSYALLLAGSGLPIIGMRTIASGKKNDPGYIGDIIITRILNSIVVFIIFLFITYYFYRHNYIFTLNAIYLLYLIPASFLIDWVFQAHHKMEYLSFAKVLNILVYLIMILLFVKNEADILWVALSWVGAALLQSVFLWIVFAYKKHKVRFRLNVRVFSLTRKAFPLATANLLSQFVLQFPVIFLSIVASNNDIANFNVAFRLITLMLIIDRVFYLIFLPFISNIVKNKMEELPLILHRLLKLIISVTLSIACFAFLFSDNLIVLIFGTGYLSSSEVFDFLMIYFILTILISVFSNTLIGMRKEKIFVKSLLIGALSFFVVLYPLYVFQGLRGIALAIGIYELVVISILIKKVKEMVKINIKIIIWPVLVTACLFFPINYYVASILIKILLTVVFVIPLILITAQWARSDVDFFKKALL